MADLEKPPGYDTFLTAAGQRGPAQDNIEKPPGYEEFVAPERKSEKYGTVPEQIKTGLESAASAATFGASKGVERALGVNPEDILAREEENPGSSFVGSTAGLVGSAALGGYGAASLLGKAGQVGATALGLGAEGAGLASRLGAGAVKAAIEGAVFQGGNEVGKLLLSDPSQSAETAVANIGMAALLGGGIGGALGGTGELWDATVGKKVTSALEGASHALTAEQSPMGDQASMLSSATQDLKPNSGSIQEAASRLGVEPSVGTLSGQKVIQNLEANLGQRPTIAGHKIAEETAAVQKKLTSVAESTLRDSTLKTEAQVGREIKNGIKDQLEKELHPIEKNYDALKGDLKKVPMMMGDVMEASGRVLDHEYVKNIPEMKPLAESLVEKFKLIKNMDELKTQRSFISDQLDKAYRSGGPEARVLQEAKDALTQLRERAIQNAESSGSVAPRTLARIKEADAAYSGYKSKLKSLGVEAGIGKVNNARALLERFAKSSDESFATKIFDAGDVNQLNFFKDNFPKEFELARRFNLKDIYDNSVSHAQGKNGQFEVGKFLAQVRDGKLGPEARDILFAGHGQKIQDIRTLYQAMPGNPNPSGTAAAISFGHMFSLAGVIDNATDAVKYAILKSLPHLQEAMQGVGSGPSGELAALHFASNAEKGADAGAFRQMAHFIGETIKGENKFSKATSAVFDSGKAVIPSKVFPTQRDREKLDERLKELQANNSGLLDVGGKVGHYMPNHVTAVAQVAANATSYLNSLRPATEKKNPLDSDIVPSQMQKSAYNRALDIAQEPLVVLDSIKEGTLTPQDLVSFKTLYPSLYSRTGQKLMHNLIETIHRGGSVPYKTRLGLSMFLGQPLDSTMTPDGIMAAQPKPMQMGSQQSPHSKGSMKDLGQMAQADMTPLQARQVSKISRR